MRIAGIAAIEVINAKIVVKADTFCKRTANLRSEGSWHLGRLTELYWLLIVFGRNSPPRSGGKCTR